MRLLVSGGTAALRNMASTPRYVPYMGQLMVPSSGNVPGHLPWACDNGAFSGFDEVAFLAMLKRLKPYQGCLWVTAPDIVADAKATAALWPEWSVRIAGLGYEPCYVLQDGQDPHHIPDSRAYFIGGTTHFKESFEVQKIAWNLKKNRPGVMIHMGRVNTFRRLLIAYDMGCDSVDGSGFSRWSDVRIPLFCRWRHALECQRKLWDLEGVPYGARCEGGPVG